MKTFLAEVFCYIFRIEFVCDYAISKLCVPSWLSNGEMKMKW